MTQKTLMTCCTDFCFIINEEHYGDKLISKQQTIELDFKATLQCTWI